MTPPSESKSVAWRSWLVAVLVIGVMWWLFRRLDVGKIWQAIEGAHWPLLGATVLVTVQTYVLRAWRWQALLRPIGRARFRTAFRTTVMGFTATFLLPGRIGEVLRPYLLARAEGFDAPATLATVIIERVLDVITVLVLFAWFLLTTSVDVDAQTKTFGAVAAGVAAVAMAVLILGAGHPARLSALAGRLTSVLPGRAAAVASRFVRTFVEGLVVVRRPGPLLAAMALSLLLWLSIALGIWMTSRAFDLTFPPTGTFLVMAFLVLGVAVPTPGGIGTFQWAYMYPVVKFFGGSENSAGACAIVLQAASVVPISILGLVFMAQDGLTLGRLKGMTPEAERAEGVAVAPIDQKGGLG